jgi:hypothetical protein
MLGGAKYSLFLGSGVSVALAGPPGDYFHRASQPLAAWLERARPDLDALFADSGLPLAPLEGPLEQVDGAIIEEPDHKAAHFGEYYRGGNLLVFVDGTSRLDGIHSLRLRIAVARRVHRRELDQLIDRVAAIVKARAAPG